MEAIKDAPNGGRQPSFGHSDCLVGILSDWHGDVKQWALIRQPPHPQVLIKYLVAVMFSAASSKHPPVHTEEWNWTYTKV